MFFSGSTSYLIGLLAGSSHAPGFPVLPAWRQVQEEEASRSLTSRGGQQY